MRLVILLSGLWGASALLSCLLAARKGRSVRVWSLLGLALGPFSLVIHAFYPARYMGRTVPCPQCGKPVGTRAVACHHCHYRFPAMDVLITELPRDPECLRALKSGVAREYGIAYADAEQMLAHLPVAGYRHLLPNEVADYARRLERLGASVQVVSSRGT